MRDQVTLEVCDISLVKLIFYYHPYFVKSGSQSWIDSIFWEGGRHPTTMNQLTALFSHTTNRVILHGCQHYDRPPLRSALLKRYGLARSFGRHMAIHRLVVLPRHTFAALTAAELRVRPCRSRRSRPRPHAPCGKTLKSDPDR